MKRYLFPLLILAACGGSDSPAGPGPGPEPGATQLDVPLTGQAVPGMESFDRVISDLMKKHKVPGGAVSVVKDGKLVYARGFGYADVENRVTVDPDALFRIASVSKPVTAVAILKLVEADQLDLMQKVLPLISDLQPPAGTTMDPRWQDITILDLLQHTGGWNRDRLTRIDHRDDKSQLTGLAHRPVMVRSRVGDASAAAGQLVAWRLASRNEQHPGSFVSRIHVDSSIQCAHCKPGA